MKNNSTISDKDCNCSNEIDDDDNDADDDELQPEPEDSHSPSAECSSAESAASSPEHSAASDSDEASEREADLDGDGEGDGEGEADADADVDIDIDADIDDDADDVDDDGVCIQPKLQTQFVKSSNRKNPNEDAYESSDELIIDLSHDNIKPQQCLKDNDKKEKDLPEHCIKVEEKLTAVAAENNLTDDNVKKILKRVVLNEHVLALVKLKEEELLKEKQTEVKLTRAKTKELKKAISAPISWPLPITPVKLPLEPVPLEVESIISQELPDEESDDEYQPNREEHSDDERDNLESSSDVDSLPLTPATPDFQLADPKSAIKNTFESPIKYSDDGVFKIPKDVEIKDDIEEVTIALRTRSKLCLSDTPIEQIEESFIPPDINFDDALEPDDVWRDFLQELPNPEPSNNEEDDEADPEYNVAADIEAIDKEELHEDDEIQVSRRELKDLINELFSDMEGMEDVNLDNMSIVNSKGDFASILSPTNIIQLDTSPKWRSAEKGNSTNNIEDVNNIKSEVQQDVYESKVNHNSEGFIQYQIVESSCEMSNSIIYYPSDVNQNETVNLKSNISEDNNSIINTTDIVHNDSIDKNIDEIDDHKSNRRNILFPIVDHWSIEEGDGSFLPDQRRLLDQQMRQHVQIITQCFLQTYTHPIFWREGPKQKEFLMELHEKAKDKEISAFRSCNLENAIKLCNDWIENMSDDTPKNRKIMKFISEDNEKIMKVRRYRGKFTPEYIDAVLYSNVFIYPYLLPLYPVSISSDLELKKKLLPSEEKLIAIGLEQYYGNLYINKKIPEKRTNLQIEEASLFINKHFVPCKAYSKLRYHIRTALRKDDINSINYFYKHGKAPPTENKVVYFNPDLRPIDHPVQSLPITWQNPVKLKVLSGTLGKEPRCDLVEERSSSCPSLPPPAPSSLFSTFSRCPSPKANDNKCADKSNESCSRTADLVERLLKKLDDHECPCLRDLRDSKGFGDEDESHRNSASSRLHNNADSATARLTHLLGLCRVPDRFVDSRIRRNLLHRLAYVSKTMLPSMPFLHTASRDNTVDDVSAYCENKIVDVDKSSNNHVIDSPNTKKVAEEKLVNRNGRLSVPNNATKQRFAAKARRELEANKAMFLNVDSYAEDAKETMYAAAYLEKVKLRLSVCSSDSENISKFDSFQNILDNFDPQQDTPCDLYRKLETLFGTENADLTEEFLTFLTPGQATEVGRFMDYFLLVSMLEFIEKLQVFFANKPAQLRKILWTLEKITEKPATEITMESVRNSILPLLKGSQYLIDWFLRLFSEEKPPESLMNNGYEIIDVEKITKDDGDEISGTITSQELLNIPQINDDYGNDNCTCSCHKLLDDKYRNRIRHCLACGTKYIQGRMFAQHGRALRPVYLNWNEGADGQQNQVQRLSTILLPRQGNTRKRPAPVENPTTLKADSDDERVSPKRNAKFPRTPTSKNKKASTANAPKQQQITSVKTNDLEQKTEVQKPVKSDDTEIKSSKDWTRDEDKTILLVLRGESNRDLTLDKIQQMLPHRTADEIRERFQSVLDLLQKIATSR